MLEETLESPWTPKRSNQSILKEISPEYSLEGLMLKLKLQYFGHLMWRTDRLEKTLMLGKTEGRRRRGQQRMRWLDVSTNSMDMSLRDSEGQGSSGVLQSMQRVGHNWVTELNWWHWIYTLKKVVFMSIKRLAHEYLWQCSLQSFKTEKTQVSINIMINKFMHWNATLKWKKDKLLILTWYGWISLTMLNDWSHTYRCCIYGMTLLTLKFKSIEN